MDEKKAKQFVKLLNDNGLSTKATHAQSKKYRMGKADARQTVHPAGRYFLCRGTELRSTRRSVPAESHCLSASALGPHRRGLVRE
jgi:hypothetical protein